VSERLPDEWFADLEGTTLERFYDGSLSRLKAEARRARAREKELEEALDRLASFEAFGVPFAVPDNVAGKELRARIDYARAALKSDRRTE
jgi:hypothetical protein